MNKLYRYYIHSYFDLHPLSSFYAKESLFLGGKENHPDVTEAFQLLLRRHLSLHHNGKDSLATEAGAVEQTPVIWLENTINQLHHHHFFTRYPLTNISMDGVQDECRWWGSNPRPSWQQSSTLPLIHALPVLYFVLPYYCIKHSNL